MHKTKASFLPLLAVLLSIGVQWHVVVEAFHPTSLRPQRRLSRVRPSPTKLDSESLLPPKDWGPSFQPQFPQVVSEETIVPAAEEQASVGEFQGLVPFSKASLVLTLLIPLGMAVSSPELDFVSISRNFAVGLASSEEISKLVESTIAGISAHGSSIDVSSVLGGTTMALKGFASFVEAVALNLQDVAKSINVIHINLALLQDGLASLQDLLVSMVQVYKTIVHNNAPMLESPILTLTEVAHHHQDTVTNAIQDSISANSQAYHKFVDTQIPVLQSSVTAMKESAQAVGNEAASQVQTWGQAIWSKVQAPMQVLSATIQNAVPQLQHTQHQFHDKVAQESSVLLTNMDAAGDQVWNQAQSGWEDISRALEQTSLSFQDSVTVGMQTVFGQAEQDMAQISGALAQMGRETARFYQEFVNQGMQQVVGQAHDNLEQASLAVSQMGYETARSYQEAVNVGMEDVLNQAQGHLEQATSSFPQMGDMARSYQETVNDGMQNVLHQAQAELEQATQAMFQMGDETAHAYQDVVGDGLQKVVSHAQDDLGQATRSLQQLGDDSRGAMAAGTQSVQAHLDSIMDRSGDILGGGTSLHPHATVATDSNFLKQELHSDEVLHQFLRVVEN